MEIKMIPRNRIIPDPDQPRETFEKESIQDLANSMKEFGLLQPILVKPSGNGNYEIIAGERRWRASKFAGIEEIACIIKDVDKRQQEVESLIENVHREDLDVSEKGKKAYQIFELYGISMPSKELAGKLRWIDDNRRKTGLSPGEQQIFGVCQKINKSLDTIRIWLESISISPEIHKAEIKKPKEERIAGKIRARLSTIEDEELQKEVYTKIEGQKMGQIEASKFITKIKIVDEETKEEMLQPEIKVDIYGEEKKLEIEIPEEEMKRIATRFEEMEKEAEEILSRPETKKRGKLFRSWLAHTQMRTAMNNAVCPVCGVGHENLKWVCHDVGIEEAVEILRKKLSKGGD